MRRPNKIKIPAPIHLSLPSGRNFFIHLPASAAKILTPAIPAVAPSQTIKGEPYCAERAKVANWVLSPSSATAIIKKLETTGQKFMVRQLYYTML